MNKIGTISHTHTDIYIYIYNIKNEMEIVDPVLALLQFQYSFNFKKLLKKILLNQYFEIIKNIILKSKYFKKPFKNKNKNKNHNYLKISIGNNYNAIYFERMLTPTKRLSKPKTCKS